VSERLYTAEEIDRMRADLESWRNALSLNILSRDVEQRLQTYIIAGVEPHDLRERLKFEIAGKSNGSNAR
jgi:hypothetical protein